MKSVAYVMQDNVHYGLLTVKQSIHYAAELRLIVLKYVYQSDMISWLLKYFLRVLFFCQLHFS